MTSNAPTSPDDPRNSNASHAKRIGIASAIWAGSILLSRVIGLVREGVLGRTLGASDGGDLYATAFVVPDFLYYLLAGGALSIVFIPIFGAHLARGEEERASEAFSVVANFLVLVLGVATVALWFAMPILAPIAAPGFSAEQLAELVTLSRIVLPAQVFHAVGGLLSASIQARDKHALPALAPLVYTLGIIGGGLLGGTSAGAYGFAWGALVGSALGPFALPLYGALKSGLRWRFTLSFAHPDLRKYLVRSLPIMIGFSIVVVDDWYLKREGTLIGPGAATILSYAKTLVKVPMGVFGLGVAVALFPTLQRLVAENKHDEMRDLLLRALRNVIVLSFAAQVVFTVAGADIVRIVYGRARLDADQVSEIALSLSLASLGLAAWSAQTLLARGFYALGNTWTPALLGTIVAVASYPIYVWTRAEYGLAGLATTSSVAILVYTLLLAYFLARRVGVSAVVRRELASFSVRALIALSAGVAAGYGGQRVWTSADSSGAQVLARGATLACVGLFAFVGAAYALRIREVESIIGPLTRRLKRRGTVN